MAEDAISAVDPSTPPSAPARTRPGAILLTRHGEPAISRKVKLTSAGYVAWWAQYEETGIWPDHLPPDSLVACARASGTILCSIRQRSIETARAVAGDRAFEIAPMLVEAPLPPPPWPNWIKLSPRTWGVLARFWWWFFDHHEDGQESREQAEVRADAVAERLTTLAEADGDVLVLAHGFFNTMIGWALKRRGWKLTEDQGFHYWKSRRFERR
jgi:broad specificity phosphatase PhoE